MKQFNQAQTKTIVDILVGVGLVGFGTVAVPVALNSGDLIIVTLGVVTSLLIWYTAIRVSKRLK